ncbi:hypothetical protein M3Y97_00822800 [Aphelenchoides bicaudatus]|nr:hypothetical protein M3Y97_00822800 [Aphelenchoides bicaudatus]
MDLNSSDLATRRKERNTNTGHSGLDAEMLMDEDGFEESEDESEECDPPPPHKILQQQKLAERRKRDQELRDQRQEKINKMVLEKQKQVQQQQEEFAQRHQLSLRATRTTSNAGLTPGTSFSLDQSAITGIKSEDRYSEYDIGNEQKPVVESLSIKLPRAMAESIGRKTSHSHDTEKGNSTFAQKASTQLQVFHLPAQTNLAHCPKPVKSLTKRSRNVQRKRQEVIASLKSPTKQSKATLVLLARKTKKQLVKYRVAKRILQRSDSSSSASSSSSGSSNSSDSRPPTLTGRLQRQSSALTDILQQDDESRQSTRSTSSIPHLLAANEPTQNWQSKETGKNSRKTSTISASTLSGYYPFELEAGTKNEFDDPESPPFAQLLASTSAKRYEDIAKQKANDAEKSRGKSSKDKTRQKHKSGDTQSGTESDKQKDEKLKDKKPKLETMKSSKSMSIDKIAERLKAKETTVLKLKIGEKDEKSKVVQKEGDKLKVKDKSAAPKNKPSPRLQPLPGVFDVPTTDSKVFKRKRDGKEAIPPTKRPPTKEAASKDGKPKDSREVSKDHKLPVLKPETSSVSKSKRPKEIKILQEIPASPLPPVQTRKRSPLPRRKEEVAKKTRLADPEFKPSSSIDKSLRSSKNAKPEEARSVVKRTLSTTSDDKRRKVRKLEKEPETPTKKKPANIFPDLPEFTGRPSLNNLKNFKIPKVVDADTTKTTEKDKEEVEREKEPALLQEREPQRDRSRESREGGSQKESRAESSRGERWDRDEKRESYSHAGERRESYAEGSYDRRGGGDSANFHPSDSNQREHFYSNRGNSAHYSSRGNKFYNSHHSNYPSSSSHRNTNSNYESSPVYNERSSFRRQRGNTAKPYDEFLPTGSHSTSKSRSGAHYTQPPHHKKSLTEISDSPSQSSRSSSAQRRYTREKSNPAPWAANYSYPEESSDYPSFMPPSGSSQYSVFNPSNQFQSPTEEQFDGRDLDFRRPPYHHTEADNSGPESPDGLQIDE